MQASRTDQRELSTHPAMARQDLAAYVFGRKALTGWALRDLIQRPRSLAGRAMAALVLGRKRLAAGALAALVLAPALAAGPAFAATPAPVRFGMDVGAIGDQAAAGVSPDFGLFWIGPWTLSSGWGGPDNAFDKMYANGVTPVVQFYYWGDDISQACIENGCWSSLHDSWKDKANWSKLTTQLIDHLDARMKGREVIVILETEFNKADVATWEPLDGYLEAKVKEIKAGYPAAKVIMGLGNWNSGAWGTFDRTAAASDFLGIQGMRGSTRNSVSVYYDLVDATINGAKKLQATFPGKPTFVTDIALSTYPEPEWLEYQADVVGEMFQRLGELKAAGVQGIVYRTYKDNPNMDLANWFGEAERHWGFAWHGNGTAKPAWATWVAGVKAERASPASAAPAPAPAPSSAPAPRVAEGSPARVEAEAFATRTAGGAQADSAAGGGKVWNLWSNGHVAQGFDLGSPGLYDLRLRARGDWLDGVGPRMTVTLAGQPVLTATPNAGALQDFTARVSIDAPGVRELKVAFDNDAKSGAGDRNLVLDLAEVAWFGSLPVPSSGNTTRVEAEDMDHPGGAVEVQDSAAAGGLALRVAQPGEVAHGMTLAPGKYAFRAMVRGEAQGRAWPDVQVTVDGVALATKRVSFATYKVIAAEGVVHAAGTHRVGFAFTNDVAPADGQDLALVVDRIAVENLGPVPNRAPVARFDYTAAGLELRLDGRASTDADGDVLSHAWDLGDGTVLHGAQVQHAYAKKGSYQVTLTVGDGKATASAGQLIEVVRPNRAPQPAFTWSKEGLTLRVTGSAVDPDGDPLTATWKFGTGATATGWAAEHTYGQNGTYVIELAVTDGELVNRTWHEVAVRSKSPITAAKPVLARGLVVEGSAAGNRVGFAFTVRNDGGTALALAELGVQVKDRVALAGPLTLEPGQTFAFGAGMTLDAGNHVASAFLTREGGAREAIPAGDAGTQGAVAFSVASA